MATITSSGIGSGLDVDGLVTQLMAFERQPIALLKSKQTSYETKVSAFGSLSSALGTFQSALTNLAKPTSFNAVSASSSDDTILKGTATSSAIAGSYSVNVSQLAQAQTLTTAGQLNSTTTIGTGATTTLSFQFGTIAGGTLANGAYTGATFTQDGERETGTVTIDSSNNSLQGIRDAVNSANMGVTATIVSDGSALPSRLVFTSTTTGATSSMKISVDGDAALNDLLGYDPAAAQKMTQSAAAQNTLLSVNGVAISSPTLSVKEPAQGLTIDVTKVGSSTLTVARDTASVKTGVTAFVAAYNTLNTTIANLSGYNAETKTAGILIGDSTVRNIQSELRKTMSASLTGLSSSVLSLPQIGIEFQRDGTLQLDSAKFDAAMTKSPDSIAGLFATVGNTSDSLVKFSSSTAATKAGTYEVNVTTMATQGKLTGTQSLTGVTTNIVEDTTLSVALDGVTSVVKLTKGSYSATQLATMMQSAINGNSAFVSAGSTVAIKVGSDGTLGVTSNKYGAVSSVGITSATGNSAASMFGVTPPASNGVDVAGTIAGLPAGGSGQVLSAAAGSNAEGLKMEITGGNTGSRGTVSFSQGYADRLSKMTDQFIGGTGLIAGTTQGLSRTITDLQAAQTRFESRMAAVEKAYRAQFTALDVMMSSMTTTSSFLTQQLDIISNQSR